LGRDKKRAYFAEVYAIVQELLRNGQVDEFISKLKSSNEKWLMDIADDSYHRSGGVHHFDPNAGQFAADFVNSYANGFGDAIKSGKLDMAKIERRAKMYPVEGFKLAVINGQRQAMKERGAKRWKRILGESERGPCEQCIADSKTLHDIDDVFVEFHNNGTCSQQFLQCKVSDSDLGIEIPVPTDETDKSRRRRI
jgi:hypothetical protein